MYDPTILHNYVLPLMQITIPGLYDIMPFLGVFILKSRISCTTNSRFLHCLGFRLLTTGWGWGDYMQPIGTLHTTCILVQIRSFQTTGRGQDAI